MRASVICLAESELAKRNKEFIFLSIFLVKVYVYGGQKEVLIHNNIMRRYTSTNKLACLISFDLLNETRMATRVIFFDKLIRCFWIDINGTLLTDGDVSSLLSILAWSYHCYAIYC